MTERMYNLYLINNTYIEELPDAVSFENTHAANIVCRRATLLMNRKNTGLIKRLILLAKDARYIQIFFFLFISLLLFNYFREAK